MSVYDFFANEWTESENSLNRHIELYELYKRLSAVLRTIVVHTASWTLVKCEELGVISQLPYFTRRLDRIDLVGSSGYSQMQNSSVVEAPSRLNASL